MRKKKKIAIIAIIVAILCIIVGIVKIRKTENGLCPEADRNGRAYIECFCVSQKVYSPFYKSSNQESS